MSIRFRIAGIRKPGAARMAPNTTAQISQPLVPSSRPRVRRQKNTTRAPMMISMPSQAAAVVNPDPALRVTAVQNPSQLPDRSTSPSMVFLFSLAAADQAADHLDQQEDSQYRGTNGHGNAAPFVQPLQHLVALTVGHAETGTQPLSHRLAFFTSQETLDVPVAHRSPPLGSR